MPYKKRQKRYKKKRSNALTRTNQYAMTTKNVASAAFTALKTASYIARLVNVEFKRHDVEQGVTVTNTGTLSYLSAVGQGDQHTLRDGISIKPMHLTLRATFHALSQDPTVFRIIIFRGKQENGIIPSITDVLEDVDVNSFKNYTDRFRSKILMDRKYVMDPVGTGITKSISWTQKLFGHINYQEAPSDLPESGGLYMILISQGVVGTGVNEQTAFNYKTRLTYTDN